jgi:2-oxo-4-hydroxy-4-carboxy-5-ureidoimidazoline decarboxylase
MRRDEFVARYGSIYEHSPWVAETVYDEGDPHGNLAERLAACVDKASRERKLELIRAHPDLAGKAAVAGDLSEASTEEQRSARLDQCTDEEYERFQALNRDYREKFGFPFVLAVRGRNREEILSAFSARLDNDPETEFETAIEEIHKIARLRLKAL